MQNAVVTVGTTATLLSATEQAPVNGQHLLVTNPGPTTVYVGSGTVTTGGATKGTAVVAGASISVDLEGAEQLHGIVASGTQDVDVLRTGV